MFSSPKAFHGQQRVSSTLPIVHQGVPHPTTQAQLTSRTHKGQHEFLIHWEGLSPADTSWQLANHMMLRYPHFGLEDKHQFEGSDVRNKLVPFRKFTKEGTKRNLCNCSMCVLVFMVCNNYVNV